MKPRRDIPRVPQSAYALVDQDGLLLGNERGPFTFPSLAVARANARRATLRTGGRLRYRAERYEGHGKLRDEFDIPAIGDVE